MNLNIVKRTYECLYTHQKIQKKKKWQDGFCEIIVSYGMTKINLLNSNKFCIESSVSKLINFHNIEEEIELASHLVQLVDISNYDENEIKNYNGKKRGSTNSLENFDLNKKKKGSYDLDSTENDNKNEELNNQKKLTYSNENLNTYVHRNKKFEIPRRISYKLNNKNEEKEKEEVEEEEKKKRQKDILTSPKVKNGVNNINLKYEEENKQQKKREHKKISVTYTNRHLFNRKKKNVKWLDGYIIKMDNTMTLYNFSEEFLSVKREENIKNEEYLTFGNFIVYNNFLYKEEKEDNQGSKYSVSNNYKYTKNNKIGNLHDTNKRYIDQTNTKKNLYDTNIKEIDKMETPINLSKKCDLHIFPNEKNSQNLEKNIHYDNLNNSPSNKLNNKKKIYEESFNEVKNKIIEQNFSKNNSSSFRKEEEYEIPFWKEDNKKMVLIYENNSRKSKYEEIINIGKIVSKNNFFYINFFKNNFYMPLTSDIMSYLQKENLYQENNKDGEEIIHQLKKFRNNMESNTSNNNKKEGNNDDNNNSDDNNNNSDKDDNNNNSDKDDNNNNNDKDDDNNNNNYNSSNSNNHNNCNSSNYNNNYYNSKGHNNNGHRDVCDNNQVAYNNMDKAPSIECTQNKKKYLLNFDNNISTLKTENGKCCLHNTLSFNLENIHENGKIENFNKCNNLKQTNLKEKKKEFLLHEYAVVREEKAKENFYSDIFEIKNLDIFELNNNDFCINDMNSINKNNLLLPIYVTILKNKINIRNKLNELQYYKIPNFFKNKSEYVLCFMNAILFQIYYEITNKIILFHNNLINSLDKIKDKNNISKDIKNNYEEINKDDSSNKKLNLGKKKLNYISDFLNEEKKHKYNNSEDDYFLLLQNVDLIYSVQNEKFNKYGKNKNKFFLKISENHNLLIEKNSTTKIDNPNKYISVNHIILLSKNNSFCFYDTDFLIFITKWNSLNNGYIEIFPLNLETFTYMNEVFENEKSESTKEYLYFLNRHKKKNFSLCLFFIKVFDHMDKLKYLFYFYKSINKKRNSYKNTIQRNISNTDINYDFLLSKLGIINCTDHMLDGFIKLNNVSIDYKNELILSMKKNKNLNGKQKNIVEYIINWFKYSQEVEENNKKGENKIIDNQNNLIKYNNSGLLINGIFGSGKSTLICNAILYLDKILSCEEKKKNKIKNKNLKIESDNEENMKNKHIIKNKEEKEYIKKKEEKHENKNHSKKILLMCNTNLGVDNILLKLKFDFDFYDFARIGSIFEINFFLITNFININAKEEKNVEELKRYLEKINKKTEHLDNNYNKKKCNEDVDGNSKSDTHNEDLDKRNSDEDIIKTEKNSLNNFNINDVDKLRMDDIHKIKSFEALINILKKKKDYILKNKYKNKRVIAGTCRSLYIFEKLNAIKESINYLIVDECTQIDELTLLKFFIKFPIKKFIFIGDIKQLSFVLKSKSDLTRSLFTRLIENELFIKNYFIKYADQLNNIDDDKTDFNNHWDINKIMDAINKLNNAEFSALKNNLYEKMFALGNEKKDEKSDNQKKNFIEKNIRNLNHILHINKLIIMNKQYRCHPSISDLCSKLFYNNNIKNGKNTKKIKILYNKYNSHINLILIKKNYKEVKYNSSYFNILEANIILSICENMIDNNIPPNEIGVITLFKYQSFYIKSKMKHLKNYNNLKKIKISTVDSFQGLEKEIILLSCVLCSFLNEKKSLNEERGTVSANDHNIIHLNKMNIKMHKEKINNLCEKNTMNFNDLPKDISKEHFLYNTNDYYESFYENKNRINVALSRAKSQLIIVAHNNFIEKNKIWKYIKSKSKVYCYD